jgi:diguanylate cyclase (GGDEF)-like protein
MRRERDRPNFAAGTLGPLAPDSDAGGDDDTDLLARRSAQILILGAGVVTVLNSLLTPLPTVNVRALFLTGVATALASVLVPMLPWTKHPQVVSYGIVVASIGALVATDGWHHYSRSDAAIAVYPIFFILVIAFAGLTQPRGTASVVAAISGVALCWILQHGGHSSAALQCIAVTVPAAAILGEVLSWSYGRALRLANLDARRRGALEALVAGSSSLQGALTPEESERIVIATADSMFGGTETRLTLAEAGVSPPTEDDAGYSTQSRELRINLRGQAGIVATITTIVSEPDSFMLDAARLYSQHIGTRLEQLRVIHALTDAATHDSLTGIPNRRAADNTLHSVSAGDIVLVADLDHFKVINDSLGHKTGDDVLQQFGEYLRRAIRPTDFAARYGGEEFLIVCRNAERKAAPLIANRLLDGWRAQRPLVTFSLGYSAHEPGDSVELTVEHADLALYEAKRAGRDCAREYQAVQQAPA